MKEAIKSKSHEKVSVVIEDIQKMVKINSVRDVENGTKTKPFGPGVDEALTTFLEIAQNMGMRIYKDPNGLYGYAEVGPEDAKEMIGILGHVDVVPVGDTDQWTKAGPFSGEIVDDTIIGRGSLDDKGPMIVNLHAVRTLMDLNVELNKRIRVIVGTAEETTWEGIEAYLEKEEHPQIGYSPDANFPLINAEKTISQFDGIVSKINNNFTLISDGAYNAVADKVKYTGTKAKELVAKLQEHGTEYQQISETEVLIIGKSAHSMACYLGKNAIAYAAMALYEIDELSPSIKFIAEKFKDTFHGELICGKVEDEVSGSLTLNIGWIQINHESEKVGFDARIPVLVNESEIYQVFKQELKRYGIDYQEHKEDKKLYVSENSQLVQALLSVYREVTNKPEAKPLSSGGGTYARALDNLVAFGMVFEEEGMSDLMHQPNECLEIRFIPLALEIYAKSLYNLLLLEQKETTNE